MAEIVAEEIMVDNMADMVGEMKKILADEIVEEIAANILRHMEAMEKIEKIV
jgi:predicted translin family RNA/ssDNA-binding protein